MHGFWQNLKGLASCKHVFVLKMTFYVNLLQKKYKFSKLEDFLPLRHVVHKKKSVSTPGACAPAGTHAMCELVRGNWQNMNECISWWHVLNRKPHYALIYCKGKTNGCEAFLPLGIHVHHESALLVKLCVREHTRKHSRLWTDLPQSRRRGG